MSDGCVFSHFLFVTNADLKKGDYCERNEMWYIWQIELVFSRKIVCGIGMSGITSVSETLKVNSSLTQLDLGLSLLLNMIN